MEQEKEMIRVPVRELVEKVLKSGSIDMGKLVGTNRAVEGTIAHKKVQQAMTIDYKPEVSLAIQIDYEGLTFLIEGRADGVIEDLIGVTIDEIKSTYVALNHIDETYNEKHWAQAKCYAYMYAKQNDLDSVTVRLTYYHLGTQKIKHIAKVYDYDVLEDFFKALIASYGEWIKWEKAWERKRNNSLKAYTFPFSNYRKGQREMAGVIYRQIVRKQKLYVNAPTGTGKTISTLFPTLKAMGEGYVNKIFYLTAKTITRTVAEETCQMMHETGAVFKVITLTAKDKICFLPERNCKKEVCLYANGHFDRIDEAIKEALDKTNLFTREVIMHYAKKHQVCPFELALDLALYVDVVIGDYNYIFDPAVSLKRFSSSSDYVILVDEAHNLVDRGREMFSAMLTKQQIQRAKSAIGKRYLDISTSLNKLIDYLKMIEVGYEQIEGHYITKEAPLPLKVILKDFMNLVERRLQEGMNELPSDFIDFYFEAQRFIKTYELYDEKYITYSERRNKDVRIKLFCLDTSYLINEVLSIFRSTIFFSATLLPINYYKYMLGGEEDQAIYLESVFEKEKTVRFIGKDISTRYKDREKSYRPLANYIKKFTDYETGNYMIFFPSYNYMESVYKVCQLICPELNIEIQGQKMNEYEREAYLALFKENPNQTVIGFCVLGGLFSEGIDLKRSRLIGVAIVGVGIPQLGIERDLIKAYFDEQGMTGYDYAYTYPGINKVLQAVGRLIRTEEDRGSILLLDNRYATKQYERLMPPHLIPLKEVTLSEAFE